MDIIELFTCFDSETPNKNSEEEAITDNVQPVQLASKSSKGVKREHENKTETVSTSSPTKRPKEESDGNLLDDINLSELNHRIVIHTIESLDSCTHEVAVPPGHEYIHLVPNKGDPVKTYPFPLDAFQKESIQCIHNNQSVLVSAHTSAGKTVVAEYAIAMSLKNEQRVIYTTPIKALSNQKYREFHDEFKDVGLVTGDVTINPSASCLIMTTEILRNMLYRGSEVMREVGWVVFDEIHYMRDKERGVVWEETLILLPHNVRFVFLSATIPNARQFAEWVVNLHSQPCHVVYTEYRPTPLQHFIYPAGGQGIHMVMDETGKFKDENYNTAMTVLQNAGDAAKGDQRGRRGGFREQDPTQSSIFKLIKLIMERSFAPVIVFSFSKKECEMYAMQMARLDFNNAAEKSLVDEVFRNAMDVLSEEDKLLPQVENLLPLLRRGIGIHHGGLLPILKETIEILFGEGLIKALFATETFAMGLNMPARTVLFTSVRKFDGTEMRWITSGEYIQMSGRAGRRGIDDKGIVIVMMDDKIPAAVGREIVKGQADPINSAFHLTYNMILNLLRVEDINPEYMLERSFYQFQNQNSIPKLYDEYGKKLEEYNSIAIENESDVESYYKIRQELDTLSIQFRSFLTKPEYLIPFLQSGRMVKIKTEQDEYDWGIVINFRKVHEVNRKKNSGAETNVTQDETKLFVDILLHVATVSDKEKIDSKNKKNVPKPCKGNDKGEMEVVPVAHKLISKISSIRVHCPDDLRPRDNRRAMLKTIGEVKKRYPAGPLLLNPINDMHIKEPEFKELCDKIEKLEERMYKHHLHNDSSLKHQYPLFLKKMEAYEEMKSMKEKLLQAKSILQLDELRCRKRVLRRMNYCASSDVVEIKGRVACELSSADELLLTELMFNDVFGRLTPEQCAALLSCFVCDEKSSGSLKMADELTGPLRTLQELARRIAKISVEARLPFDEESYVEKFRPHLMDVVHAWCKGVTFSQVCKMTDIFEGSVIRCMRRLEELLRQMCQASKTIGNSELENKFATAIKLIKRDIVFAASLYL